MHSNIREGESIAERTTVLYYQYTVAVFLYRPKIKKAFLSSASVKFDPIALNYFTFFKHSFVSWTIYQSPRTKQAQKYSWPRSTIQKTGEQIRTCLI